MSSSCGAMARPLSAKLRETLEVGDSDQIVQLRDGTKALIRPIGPNDRQRLKEGFESSSDESRFLRFLAPMPELSSRQLNYLTDVDHDHHEALIAIDPETGASFGTARYVRRDDDPKTAEVAVGVGDRWMRIGLGTALMNALVRRAREVGVVRITAVIHAENTAAKALLAKVAGPAGSRSRAAGWGVKEIVVDLESERLDAKRSQVKSF
jgi:RimJ/RimL family protein N-acetyltransferase